MLTAVEDAYQVERAKFNDQIAATSSLKSPGLTRADLVFQVREWLRTFVLPVALLH